MIIQQSPYAGLSRLRNQSVYGVGRVWNNTSTQDRFNILPQVGLKYQLGEMVLAWRSDCGCRGATATFTAYGDNLDIYTLDNAGRLTLQ